MAARLGAMPAHGLLSPPEPELTEPPLHPLLKHQLGCCSGPQQPHLQSAEAVERTLAEALQREAWPCPIRTEEEGACGLVGWMYEPDSVIQLDPTPVISGVAGHALPARAFCLVDNVPKERRPDQQGLQIPLAYGVSHDHVRLPGCAQPATTRRLCTGGMAATDGHGFLDENGESGPWAPQGTSHPRRAQPTRAPWAH